MITDKAKYLVAEKPIKCYKVMHPIDRYGVYKFSSEYIGYIYTLGEEYTLNKSEKFPEVNTEDLCGRYMRVNKGFHSYARKEDAWWYSRWDHLAVVECEIPAGARYWEGDEGGYPGYCSDRIRVVAWKPWNGNEWIRAVPPAGAVQT
jgi:hypothetical protein